MKRTIELTYNWGQDDYEVGTGFGHLAIGVDTWRPPATMCANSAGKSLAKQDR